MAGIVRRKQGTLEGTRCSLNEAPWGLEQVCIGEDKTAYLSVLVSL